MKITATCLTIALASGFALPNAIGQSASPQSSPVKQQTAKQGSDGQIVNHSAFRPVLPSPTTTGFQQKAEERPLKVKIYPFYNKLPVNEKCLIAIELDIAKGWHINANPANPDWMKPTVVTLKSKHDIKLSKIKYPKHHELPVAGSDDPYYVYDGKTMVYVQLDIKNLTPAKSVELEFHVHFQGCNSGQCLPPDSIVMKGKLPVAAVGETLKKINAEKFPKPKKKEKEAAPKK
ncbi:MAG: protein-disulfide reductase DsbD domain-containing protein [Fuerstiella sp.]